MDVFECIKTRRSIRRYLQSPVEWGKVGTVLEAGKAAPSAGNVQDWKFIVVTSPEQKKGIAHACMDQQWIATAPVIVVVLAEPDKQKRLYGLRGEGLYTVQDCAAAIQNMLLMAHALGLGSCWVGSFNEEALRRVMFIPEEIKPQAIVTLGYPDEIVPEPPEYTLENVVFFRDFGGQGNRMKNIPASLGEYGSVMQGQLKKGAEVFKRLAEKIKKN